MPKSPYHKHTSNHFNRNNIQKQQNRKKKYPPRLYTPLISCQSRPNFSHFSKLISHNNNIIDYITIKDYIPIKENPDWLIVQTSQDAGDLYIKDNTIPVE
jgi:hypothetical protein